MTRAAAVSARPAPVIAILAGISLGALLAAGAAGTDPNRDQDAARRVAQPGTAEHGREIYAEKGCASCHAASLEQEARDGLLRAGHPLEGVAHRGTWWNGRITTDAGDASEFCLRTFIDPASQGFTAEERKALVLFMQELGSERGVSPLVLLRRDAGDVDLASGDSARGEGIYRRACLACHPSGPSELSALAGDLSPAQMAELIRKGTGTMPFFQVDRLTAPQVADVVAFLEEARRGAPGAP
ncbi:MAG TPA: c-type cytochrome [Candidatus Polarisedimenticolia bacterium]|nr:c-type cytochrome [Candidatus Polarisedimenticolia bacterium]